MDKTGVLQALAGILLLSILFTPQNSDMWMYFLAGGLTFGTLWFVRLP